MVKATRAERDWRVLGATDPYHSVLTDPRFKADRLDAAALDEFYATGAWHADAVLAVFDGTFGAVPRGRALDFGCGVGRTSSAFARHFDTVVGLDVSDGMLDNARAHAQRQAIGNLIYARSSETQHLAPATYDLVHTFLVLQHIPREDGERIIATLIEAIQPNGFGAIHFIYAHASRRAALGNAIIKTPARGLANLALRRPWGTPWMQMNTYPIARVLHLLAAHGIERFHMIRTNLGGTLGLFVFFQTPDGPRPQTMWSDTASG